MSGLDLQKHFSLQCVDEIKQICDPALKMIGVTYFNYIKIYNHDSSRALLTNNAPWIQHFYKENLYKSAGAIDIEHLLPKGYFLWSELDTSDPVYAQGRESFDIDNGISFVIRRDDVTYLYIFASNKDNHKINNFYVRNIDLLKRFIQYFNDKASNFVKLASNNKIYLPEKQIIQAEQLNQINISNEDREKFYKNTELDKFYLLSESDNLYLTKKQAECAAYIIAGATAKECAKELHLSFRTVEEHLSDIKNKISAVKGTKINREEMIRFLKGSGFHDAIFPQDFKFK